MKTQMKKIHEVSINESVVILEDYLKETGLRMSEIDYLIPHQTSKSSIIEGSKRYESILKDKPGEIVINLKYSGNTASTTHFIAMHKYLMENRFKKGERVMLLSFASGLEIGIVAFKLNLIIDDIIIVL